MGRCARIVELLTVDDPAGPPAALGLADLGCGSGRLVRELLDVGFPGRIHALDHISDLDDDLLVHPQVRSVIADLDARLPFEDASLGRVVSAGVLEHLVDPVAHLREVHRVLAPGAVAVLCHSDWDTSLFTVGPGLCTSSGVSLDVLTRRLVDRFVDAMPTWVERADGFMGRRLLSLVAGTDDLDWADVMVDTWADPHRRFDEDSLARKVATGITMAAAADPDLAGDVEPWLTALESAADRGEFLFTVTDVAVRVRRA